MGTHRGCLDLASTGHEAYAGGGFHRGATTTHATRHTLCAWTEWAAQQHNACQPAPPPVGITREEDEQALAMRTPNAARFSPVEGSRREPRRHASRLSHNGIMLTVAHHRTVSKCCDSLPIEPSTQSMSLFCKTASQPSIIYIEKLYRLTRVGER